ncbi:UNVERIFIED_ORG: ProQ/FinO family protein [Shinella sp. XGS7]|nr:ProQ/FinO family protein [Shinella sp. XGS7]
MSSPTPEGVTAAEAAPQDLSPAAALQQLKALFPALFDGPPKPLKLRIQADIQERAPGQFSKPLLSAVLRRYTGGTAYLVALSKAKQRFDLDGQPAGELSDEHREAAAAELARRRGLAEERRAQELQERRQRANLLRDFEHTTLTRANFCALKGVKDEELDGLLEIARKELEEDRIRRASQPQGEQRRGPHERRGEGPRRDGGQRPPRREGGGGGAGRQGKPRAPRPAPENQG